MGLKALRWGCAEPGPLNPSPSAQPARLVLRPSVEATMVSVIVIGQHGVETIQELGGKKSIFLPVLKNVLCRRVREMGTGSPQSPGLPLSFTAEATSGHPGPLYNVGTEKERSKCTRTDNWSSAWFPSSYREACSKRHCRYPDRLQDNGPQNTEPVTVSHTARRI